MAYYLPTTDLSLTISVPGSSDQEKHISAAMAPVYVADKSYKFRLSSSRNELFSRHHQISVTDGLIQCVDINDTGELDSVVGNLVKAAVVIASKNPSAFRSNNNESLGNKNRGNQVTRWNQPPTKAEIEDILSQLAPGSHKFVGSVNQTITHKLPGGYGIVYAQAYLKGRIPKAGPAASAVGLTRSDLRYPGVFYRPTRKVQSHMKLYITLAGLISYRDQTLTKEARENVQGKIDTYRNSGKRFTLFHHAGHVAVTDDTQLAYQPLPRSPIGNTTHKLTITDGVPTKIDSNTPGALKGATKMVLDSVRAIVDIPRQAIIGKQNMTAERQKLLNAQKQLLADQEELLKQREKFLKDKQKQLDEMQAAQERAAGTTPPPAQDGGGGAGGVKTGEEVDLLPKR